MVVKYCSIAKRERFGEFCRVNQSWKAIGDKVRASGEPCCHRILF